MCYRRKKQCDLVSYQKQMRKCVQAAVDGCGGRDLSSGSRRCTHNERTEHVMHANFLPTNTTPARPSDQRTSPRVLTTRPVKLFHPATARFIPAHTCDMSGGGVLLQVAWPTTIVPGEPVDVYIPPDQHVVMSDKHRVPSTVLRVLASGDIAMISVKFNVQQQSQTHRAAA